MTEEKGFIFQGSDGEREMTIDEVRELAEKEDPDALYALGMAYLFGWDIEEDPDLGYSYLEKAVDLGQTEAMTLLVRLFMQGEYTGIDNNRAASYAIQASKDGNPEAQLFAGLAYMDGISVKQDYKEAARLFRLSANQGNSEARTSLAYMFQNGLGVEKDEKKAFSMFRTAAKAGNINAMFHTGICYEFGNGTPIDLEAAEEWYRKGSEQGDAFASERLGYLCLRSTPPREKEAFEHFISSALEGIPTAMEMAGYCYRNGIGTPVDEAEAEKWYRLANDNSPNGSE